MKNENFSPKRNHILSISGYKLSQFTFHARKSGLFERTEIFFLRPGLLAVGGTIVARDVIHPLLDQLLRDPQLYLNKDRKMSRLQAFLVLYECSFKKPRVSSLLSASSANLCYSKLLAKNIKSRYMKKTRSSILLHSFFARTYIYIYIYISLEKNPSLFGDENNNVAHNAPIYLCAKWQPSIRLEQRETTNYRRSKKDQRRPKCTVNPVNVQLSTLTDCH